MNLQLSAALLVFAGAVIGPCQADGTVILDFHQNLSDNVARLRVNSDDSFHVQVSSELGGSNPATCGFFRMGPDGTLISTFGSQGRLLTGECAKDFAVRANGALDVLDASGLYLQFRDASGTLVSTSGDLPSRNCRRV